MQNLLTGATTVGAGTSVHIMSSKTVFVSGNLTGTTIVIELSPDSGVTWYPTSTQFTGASTALVADLNFNSRIVTMHVRANVTIADVSTNVTVNLA